MCLSLWSLMYKYTRQIYKSNLFFFLLKFELSKLDCIKLSYTYMYNYWTTINYSNLRGCTALWNVLARRTESYQPGYIWKALKYIRRNDTYNNLRKYLVQHTSTYVIHSDHRWNIILFISSMSGVRDQRYSEMPKCPVNSVFIYIYTYVWV